MLSFRLLDLLCFPSSLVVLLRRGGSEEPTTSHCSPWARIVSPVGSSFPDEGLRTSLKVSVSRLFTEVGDFTRWLPSFPFVGDDSDVDTLCTVEEECSGVSTGEGMGAGWVICAGTTSGVGGLTRMEAFDKGESSTGAEEVIWWAAGCMYVTGGVVSEGDTGEVAWELGEEYNCTGE